MFFFYYIDVNNSYVSSQLPTTATNVSYAQLKQQQSTSVVNEEKSEPPLITFD